MNRQSAQVKMKKIAYFLKLTYRNFSQRINNLTKDFRCK